MTELSAVCQAVADDLNGKGIRAVSAWGTEERRSCGDGVVAVSVRSAVQKPGALWDYLGERYDAERDRWEELYGRRLELTLGLDLYAGGDGDGGVCEVLFNKLAEALDGAKGWLRQKELRRGATVYRETEDCFCCPVEADCLVALYAAAEDGGAFRDFEVRRKNI